MTLISVVICTKNSYNDLVQLINLLKKEIQHELIVIDGNSSDETLSFLSSNKITFYPDFGRGMAYARSLGVLKSSGEYICFIGPDNRFHEGFLSNFLRDLSETNLDAATCKTRIHPKITNWDFALNFRFICFEISNIAKKVIGTPTMIKSEVFNLVSYNPLAGACDDTKLSDDLIKYGFSIGRTDTLIFEQGGLNLKKIFNKFKLYGSGDYDYYNLNKGDWTFLQKASSLCHPFQQFIEHSKISFRQIKIKYIVFLFAFMIFRYYGFINRFIFKFSQ